MNATMEAVETVETDEGVAPEVKERIEKDLEPFKQQVALLEMQSKEITVVDKITHTVATEFIAGAKRLFGNMEELRDEKVRPHNDEVRLINKAYKPYTTMLDRLWRTVDQIKSDFEVREQQLIEEANRKAIAEAAERKRIQEAKEEEARKEAERLRLEAERIENEENERILKVEMDRQAAEQKIKDDEAAVIEAKRKGDAAAAAAAQRLVDDARIEEETRVKKAEEDRLAAVAEQARLERAAIKQDAKADIAASQATMIAPTIHVNETSGKTVLADGSTAGSRKVEECYFENGAPVYTDITKKKYVEYHKDDPRMAGIEIPDHCWVLDMGNLIKIRKAGVLIKGMGLKKGTATTAPK